MILMRDHGSSLAFLIGRAIRGGGSRTRLINSVRGLVAEIGIYIPGRLARVIGFAEDITHGEMLGRPDIANKVIRNLSEQLMALH